MFGEIGSVSMGLVCEGLMSNWWWGYCCVLVASGGGVFELQCKVQGCKCHPAQAFDLHGSDSYYRRRRAYEREAVAAGV